MSAAMINRLGLALVALLTLAAPWLLPLVVDGFWVDIYSEMLIWSLLAASVNLLFGYVGLLSFGQALFFGMGMYGVAIGVAKLGLGFWPAFGLGVVMATAMALVAGALAVRLTWHYFAIITVVFSLIFYFLALSSKELTGGDDGTPFSMPPMFTWGDWELSLS
ncbi:MAG: branched-chain amino acid ABC transporter permease, partial [Rhodospirillales bacterium]